MSLLQNSNAIPQLGGYNLTDSVRFRSSAGAVLERTPSSTGNRRTFTWSCWIKRGSLSSTQTIFRTLGASDSFIRFTSSDAIEVRSVGAWQLITSNLFRDTSAWYHIIWSMDTTESTSTDRAKVYINGEQVTSFSTSTYPTSNYETSINQTNKHTIGRYPTSSTELFDGYMTEVNFVDGQALTPSDFGSYDGATGVWKPIEYTGTYGTNGFYLPMKATTQATGFNTVLWAGNGGTQSITGVGFSPDLVWVKSRTDGGSHVLQDSVRGVGSATKLSTNSTNAENNSSADATDPIYGYLTSINSDGFTAYVGTTPSQVNKSGQNYVAWCWDAGSSTVSNTDGTITSSVRANPATGFSIVTWTGNGGVSTIGHGLGAAPKMIIVKQRNAIRGWVCYNSNLAANQVIYLNVTNAANTDTTAFNATAPTSSVFTVGTSADTNQSAGTYVAYCFSEVAGFSKFGSYTGNGTSQSINLGFRPAFVMWKRIDAAGNSWIIKDNTRYADNQGNLFPNLSNAENTDTNVTFTNTGFDVDSSLGYNGSGRVFIYMAFADTRDFQWNFDASGNHNNWTPNNINSNASSETTYDIMSDVPTLTDEDTANFATLNPLASNSVSTLSNANLDVTSSTAYYNERATIELPSSGKWYFECYLNTVDYVMGVMKSSIANNVYMAVSTNAWVFVAVNGNKANGSQVSYDSASVAGQTIGVAMNMDNGELTFYRNGVSLGVAFTIADTSNLVFGIGQSTNNLRTQNANFGQRPFAYTPPTGYLKLNTFNLPDSTIVDGSQYMNTVTYTGNGTGQSIAGVGFSPNLLWIKSRSNAFDNTVFDTNRGVGVRLITNTTAAETATSSLQESFDSDGFTLKTAGSVNQLNSTYVAWNWRGSDSSAVSNTDGDIASQVSANTTSGFSVVTYTGTGVNATVGHGLGVAPKMIINKNRSSVSNWVVQHDSLGWTQGFLGISTVAATTQAAFSNDTAPTNDVFSIGAYSINSSENYVAYCFAEVEGFSKFGSYTGNGSTDGPFVYTGFRPAFVMFKRTDATGHWYIYDSTRDTYNVIDKYLIASLTNVEGVAVGFEFDYLSNGIKLRGAGAAVNASGGSYIYMAFAENPFKNSLAR